MSVDVESRNVELTCPRLSRTFPSLCWPCLQSTHTRGQREYLASGTVTHLPLDQAVNVFAVNVLVVRVKLPLHSFRLFFHLRDFSDHLLEL